MLFDKLHEVRQEYDLFCTVSEDSHFTTGADVVKAYNGGRTARNSSKILQTIIQMKQTASKLKMCVIDALGEILNEERRGAVTKNCFLRSVTHLLQWPRTTVVCSTCSLLFIFTQLICLLCKKDSNI